MNRFVIVSGLPASGKAMAIAQNLGLPMLDKDTFLETLLQTLGIGDIESRRALSNRADRQFQEQANKAGRAVLASWWKHPQSPLDSGTPIEWLANLPGVPTEAHCRCSPRVAAKRFLSHPGHLDGRWSYADLLASFTQ